MPESHPSGKYGATVPVELSHPTNGQEKLYNGIARRNAATAARIDWTHAENMDDATIEKTLFPDWRLRRSGIIMF